MSKTFTCCELVKAIKECQEAKKNNWPERDKLVANEFLYKASWRMTERIKEWVNSEAVWKADCDYLFCDECNKWFEYQRELQKKLIDAQIEKEKTDGTFYSNPATQETLEKFKRKADEVSKELERNEPKNNPPPFGKSPQE